MEINKTTKEIERKDLEKICYDEDDPEGYWGCWRLNKCKIETKKGGETIIDGYFLVEDLEVENQRFFCEQLFAEYAMEYGLL